MNKTKILIAAILILLLITFLFLPKDKEFCVKNVISPTEIQLNNNEILKLIENKKSIILLKKNQTYMFL